MRCDARPLALALALLAALAPRAVRAEPTSDDRAAAEALFKSARALIEAGDYHAACPKFDAAFALNPSPSILLNIARCHEHDGKLTKAWSDYGDARALNRDTKGEERQLALDEIAKKGLADLEQRLPKLRIVIAKRPPGLRVTRDGRELPAATLGEALPADPGAHEVIVSAPGYRRKRRAVNLVEGRVETLDLVLVQVDAGGPAGDDVEPDPTASKPGPPAWAWISGGLGLALGGVGAGFLADDLAAIRALRAGCHTIAAGTWCNPGYDYASDNARKNLDFGLFVGLGGVGAIALGAAVVGLVRAPSSPPAAAWVRAVPFVGAGSAGAAIVGGF